MPITRIGKFFDANDFELDTAIGAEWLYGDMNFTVVLYRIDRMKTKTDDVYGEALKDGIKFLPPIELKGYVQIMAPENKTCPAAKQDNKCLSCRACWDKSVPNVAYGKH